MKLDINNPSAEYILREISRVSRNLKILKDSIDFKVPDEPQTLDVIMKSIKDMQAQQGEIESSIAPDSEDEISEWESEYCINTVESWMHFDENVEIILSGRPYASNEIDTIPIYFDSNTYIENVFYYTRLLDYMSDCQEIALSKYNTNAEIKCLCCAYKQLSHSTNVINYAYAAVKNFEVDVTDVFNTDTVHWNEEYNKILTESIYTFSLDEIYDKLTEVNQLIHKYCAFILKLSETGFEQFSGTYKMLNDEAVLIAMILRYFNEVRINN